MTENPYQAPVDIPADSDIPVVSGVLSGSRDDLRSVARYQKGILICILVYFVVVGSQFALPAEGAIIIGIGLLAVVLVGAFFTLALAMKVYGTVAGILLGILTLVPLLGLLVLLVVNGKATRILKQNGIRVGLLGANTSQI